MSLLVHLVFYPFTMERRGSNIYIKMSMSFSSSTLSSLFSFIKTVTFMFEIQYYYSEIYLLNSKMLNVHQHIDVFPQIISPIWNFLHFIYFRAIIFCMTLHHASSILQNFVSYHTKTLLSFLTWQVTGLFWIYENITETPYAVLK